MSPDKVEFNPENLDNYLKELAKMIKKHVGKQANIELILIGGTSILINYGFRQKTFDFDVMIIPPTSSVKEAIRAVEDRNNLQQDWMNTQFKYTTSYSPKLRGVSVPYKDFYGVLSVKTVTAEYLVAMKLMSGRKYKHDFSDVVGILKEHAQKGTPLSIEQIKNAVITLYDSWEKIPEHSRNFIESVIKLPDYSNFFQQIQAQEEQVYSLTLQFKKDYPDVLKGENVDKIVDEIMQKNGISDVTNLSSSPLAIKKTENNTENNIRKIVDKDEVEMITKIIPGVKIRKQETESGKICIMFDSSKKKEVEELLTSIQKQKKPLNPKL